MRYEDVDADEAVSLIETLPPSSLYARALAAEAEREEAARRRREAERRARRVREALAATEWEEVADG